MIVTARLSQANDTALLSDTESAPVNCTVEPHAYGEWKMNETSHWKECTVCTVHSDEGTHSYGEWTVTKAATATETGKRERYCTVCHYKETETIPATGAEPSNPSPNPPQSTPPQTSTPQNTATTPTGDNLNPVLYAVLIVVCAAGISIAAIMLKRRTNK